MTESKSTLRNEISYKYSDTKSIRKKTQTIKASHGFSQQYDISKIQESIRKSVIYKSASGKQKLIKLKNSIIHEDSNEISASCIENLCSDPITACQNARHKNSDEDPIKISLNSASTQSTLSPKADDIQIYANINLQTPNSDLAQINQQPKSFWEWTYEKIFGCCTSDQNIYYANDMQQTPQYIGQDMDANLEA